MEGFWERAGDRGEGIYMEDDGLGYGSALAISLFPLRPMRTGQASKASPPGSSRDTKEWASNNRNDVVGSDRGTARDCGFPKLQIYAIKYGWRWRR